VLKKHNASATFFIRTNFVSTNPNLLRAIALEGHSIASHTHNHLVLSNDTGTGKMFTDLTPAQVGELTQDLVASYQELQSIVGDISINGRPALTRLFRPPTLSVGKSGLTAVLDSGFSYSVSGSTTLNDYRALDAAQLAKTLKSSTKSGAVLVMHMSDSSIYTAEALDLYLTEMANQTGKQAFRFVSLVEVLK
jgi:peptidoglycan/xylan/chitin deacetylase (PgdA/CDA1 family)